MTAMLVSATIYFIDPSSDLDAFIDPIEDVPLAQGALTWRSYGQDVPLGSTYVWTIGKSDDLREIIAGSVLQTCRHTIDANEDQLLVALEALIEKIEEAEALETRFEYQHSQAYYDLIDLTVN